MFWLSLLIPVSYIPGVTGASLATGWAAMSIGLPWATWREGSTMASPIPIILGLVFFLYACISLNWVDNPDTALSTLWFYLLMGGAFYAGTQSPDLVVVTRGLALGFGISSLLAIAQAFGFDWIIEYVPCRPSGLLYNPLILGEGCALTILLCLSYRLYWLAGLLLPGLALSQSRSAGLALVVGLVLTYCRPQRSLFSFTPIWAACSISHGTADNFRWMIWSILYHFLTFWGHGAGSVEAVLIRFNGQLYAPGYAHNEFLDLLYQYGVGALPAIGLLLVPATSIAAPWPCYMGFLTLCVFSFPLHSPPLAFGGMVVAGCLLRDWSFARLRSDLRGPWALPSLAHSGTSPRALANQLGD
jgi:hypothetical protein